MAVMNAVLRSSPPNRRRRVRHKIHAPGYAAFNAEPDAAMLELHEIVDISEEGVAIQYHSPLELDKAVSLCLELAEYPGRIYTQGQVVWSNENGRIGIRFAELPPQSLSRLREWLFVNVMAGVANSEIDPNAVYDPQPAPRPSYSDTLAAVTAVQRQVESLGSDFNAALLMITERAQTLLRASGAAIALVDSDPEYMVCRASSGSAAPPTGMRLQVGSGFSGECVERGVVLRCDDTQLDSRVDPESCRALGIHSILAAPVQVGDNSVGLIEVLSDQPNHFSDHDGEVLQRLAAVVLEAANRAPETENLPILAPPPVERFVAPQGSVLFASADEEETSKPEPVDEGKAGVRLPRSYLLLLTCAASTIAMALGFLSAPWIQGSIAPWVLRKIHSGENAQPQTVLASSKPPRTDPASPSRAVDTATLEQLQQMAEKGNPSAQYALGLRYATGDGVTLNEKEEVRWFTKAAEAGNVPAQSKLGSIYYSGRGVPQDANRAYFWMVVAWLGGDDASKTLAPFVRARLTRAQIAAIEQDASQWLQQHSEKPVPGQLKSSLK